MYVRGNGSGQEFRRNDQSFYRGVVVKNNDPLKLNRVKIYISELSNQPFDEWFEKYDSFDIKMPGFNNPDDTWTDTKIFEQIASTLPWAEPCYPIIGESGNSRYYKDGEISTISDSNYLSGFEVINTETPTLTGGSFSPAFLYENKGTAIGDAFGSPLQNFAVKNNPYAFQYKPSKHVNKAKGMFGIPEVGSKVWIFHYQGNLNFPVYIGVYRDFRELTLMNNTDNEEKISSHYPSDFES